MRILSKNLNHLILIQMRLKIFIRGQGLALFFLMLLVFQGCKAIVFYIYVWHSSKNYENSNLDNLENY